MQKKIYLDNNASTPLDPAVREYFIAALQAYGNSASLHSFGREAAELVHEARQEAGKLIHAAPEDIIFNSGGTEANNTVLSIFTPGNRTQGFDQTRTELVVSAIEHPAVLETAGCLAARYGMKLHIAPVDAQGRVRPDALEKLVTEKTALVSILFANNETGVIQDLADIARLAHARGAFVHSDAVQAVGKIPVDVHALGLDYLSASGHKIYAPKGAGFLWRRKGAPYVPYAHGGHQEHGLRAGTVNAPAVAALGKACALAAEKMADESARLSGLRDHLRAELEKRISDTKFNGCEEASLPNTLNLSFRAAEGESILLYLDLEGIAVSTGSACASGSLEPSHVLLACGLGAELAHGSLRFSLGRMTSAEEIEYVIEKLPPIIARIRNMSTIK